MLEFLDDRFKFQDLIRNLQKDKILIQVCMLAHTKVSYCGALQNLSQYQMVKSAVHLEPWASMQFSEIVSKTFSLTCHFYSGNVFW